MAMFETWLKSDLKKPLYVQQLDGNMFSADNEGNLVGVEVMDNGTAASLSGGVSGYVIRADNATLVLTGTLNGNKASIILPQSAYIVPGRMSIVIKVGTTTVGACTANVYQSTTDTLVDPGHVIPSIEELLAHIAACDAATAAAMKVANMTVSAEAATGSTPDAVLSEEGSGSSAHKHITFKLVPGNDGYSPSIVVTTITGGHRVAITGASGTSTFDVMDGTDGTNGTSAYVWIKYSHNQPTQDSDMKATADDWMGVYSGTASSAPAHYTDYTWYKIKGETGSAENIYGSTVPMSPEDSTKVATAIAGKLSSPSTAGTSGQVLTSDGQGGQSWQTPSGGTVTDVQEDGTSILSGGVANILTMTGAGSSTAGTKGLVPAPASGDNGKFLKGNGTWDNVPNPQVMTGATASAAGTSGLVPAPAAGQNAIYYLRGDGTWNIPPGAKLYVVDLDTVTNTSGSYTHSTTASDVSSDMKPVLLELSNPAAFGATVTVTPGNGSITLSCSSVSGTSTVKVGLMFVAGADTLTSSEFDVLAGRIGTLSSLTTTNKGNLVAAVNELDSDIGTLNAENNYDGSSAASLTAAIETAIDALANDNKMHVITVTKGARVILLVQKYSSIAYASYVGYCYALTNPISGQKVNGTWTHDTLALNTQIEPRGTITFLSTANGTGERTLAYAIREFKYIFVQVGYYASGWACYGTAMIPVSAIATNTDTNTYGFFIPVYINNGVGWVQFGFSSQITVKVNTNTANYYVRFMGVK